MYKYPSMSMSPNIQKKDSINIKEMEQHYTPCGYQNLIQKAL